MVMPNDNDFPSQGFLDYFSRNDELLVRLIKVVEAMELRLDITIPGDGGDIIPGPYTLPIDELRRRILLGEWIPYTTWPETTLDTPNKTQLLTTAVTDQ